MPAQIRISKDKNQLFAYAFNNFYVEISRVVTTKFYGDLDLFLVLVAIATNSISSIMARPNAQRKYPSVAVPNGEDYSFIKLLPLSESVGLPRTTVRRKVEKLMHLGYIEYREGHGYRIIKRKMAETNVINNILEQQQMLLGRLINWMTERDVLVASSALKRKPAGF